MTMAGSLVMVVMVLTVKGDAVCFDAYHSLTVEGAPGAFPLSASNGEVPAANDAGRLESVASTFDLLGVTRVELQLAKAAVSFAELYGNDAATSIKDEALNDVGFGLRLENGCHGKKKREALASLNEQ
jgi:hypothetical protein